LHKNWAHCEENHIGLSSLKWSMMTSRDDYTNTQLNSSQLPAMFQAQSTSKIVMQCSSY